MILSKRKYTLWDGVKITFTCAFIPASLWIVLSIAGGALGPLTLMVNIRFIDTAIAIAGGQNAFTSIIIPLSFLIAIFAYGQLQSVISNFTDSRIIISLRKKLRLIITEKRTRLKYRYIEDHATWDLISRVSADPENGRLKQTFTHLISIVSALIRIGGIVVIIAQAGWWVAPLIIGIALPLFIIAAMGGKKVYEKERELSELERKSGYYHSELLLGRETAAERNLFGFTNHVSNAWKQFFETTRKKRLKVNVIWWMRYKAGAIATAMVGIGVMVILTFPLGKGAISTGFYIAVITAMLQLQGYISVELVKMITELAQDREYFRDLTKFAHLEEHINTLLPPAPLVEFQSLEFRNVFFRYPGTENYVLQGVSFTLKRGTHYALVGANGSGKTTITKLMLGLYDVDEGEIFINGHGISEYSQDKLCALFSVVYQDFAKYYITIRENIGLGDVNNIIDEKRIENAANKADLTGVIEKLPNGYETPLGKILPRGVDISGGEWQRIALARSHMSIAPFRILDEPTAALDPIAESELYRKYGEVTSGETTLFISHRLGSTKLSDIIIVLDNGKITEFGSHNELMNTHGLYREMFSTQRKWYEKHE